MTRTTIPGTQYSGTSLKWHDLSLVENAMERAWDVELEDLGLSLNDNTSLSTSVKWVK